MVAWQALGRSSPVGVGVQARRQLATVLLPQPILLPLGNSGVVVPGQAATWARGAGAPVDGLGG